MTVLFTQGITPTSNTAYVHLIGDRILQNSVTIYDIKILNIPMQLYQCGSHN